MSRRRGYLLVEALCAVALAGIVATAAALALSGVRRSIRASDLRAESARGGREALLVLTALLRDADGVRVEAETALALSVRTAASMTCAVDSASFTLPPVLVTVGDPLTLRSQPIEAGDEISVLVRDSATGVADWWRAEVDSVVAQSGAEPCGSSGGWASAADATQPRLRLFTTPAPAGAFAIGAAVRVARPGRLSLYASSGGEWMLGWRRCSGDPPRCGVVQPVAGPLRTPGTGGLRARASGLPGGLLLEVRAPGDTSSLRSLVILRDAP